MANTWKHEFRVDKRGNGIVTEEVWSHFLFHQLLLERCRANFRLRPTLHELLEMPGEPIMIDHVLQAVIRSVAFTRYGIQDVSFGNRRHSTTMDLVDEHGPLKAIEKAARRFGLRDTRWSDCSTFVLY